MKSTDLIAVLVGLATTMMSASGGEDTKCKCATGDQIKSCITRVAKAWNGTIWKRGHDCRYFVQAAETECCLGKCFPRTGGWT